MSGVRRLVIFGDSFVEGYYRDENDEPTYQPFDLSYWFTEKYGIDVTAIGFRGNGNAAISNSVFRYIQRFGSDDVAFLIVWSGWDRLFLQNPDEGVNSFYHIAGIDRLHYERLDDVWSDGIARWTYEAALFGVVKLCEEHNVPFLMTNSVCNQISHHGRLIYNKNKRLSHIEEGFDILKPKDVNKYWIEFDKPNNTMYDIIVETWLSENHTDYHSIMKNAHDSKKINEGKEYKYMTNCKHPNAKGYELIVDTLEPYIRRIL